MPTLMDQMLEKQRQEMHDTIAAATEQALRLRASHDRLLAVVREVAAFFEDTDAPLGIKARAAVAAGEGV